MTNIIKESQKKFSGMKVSMPENGKCPIDGCEWICKSRCASTFSEHIRQKHTACFGREENYYKCSYCDAAFNAKTHLNHHIANHHHITYHECPHPSCSYIAKNKQSLCSHYSNKHLKELKKLCLEQDICVCCGKEDIKSGLAYHLALCSPESLLCRIN